MLKFFNRLEKTRNFILILFAVVMAASLILFYAPTRDTAGVDYTVSTETAASVSGNAITAGEVYRLKQAYSNMLQGRSYPAASAVNNIITSRIGRVEAERLGLTASDKEVANAIRERFTPQDGTPFDQKLYEENAIQQAGSIAAFEQQIRDDVSMAKLQAFITAGVSISEEEVLQDYQKKNTKFDVSYVTVNGNDLAKTITPTDQELQEYFEKNKSAYYISSPQKKIKYIFISTPKIGEKLAISDADLRSEYDNMPEDKKKAGVLGQEIVLRVSKPEFDGQVYEKAQGLVTQLKAGGDTVTKEAFADMAKGQSENAASAPKGGDLPGPVKENPNNPTDPYQRLLKMKPGEITEPIKYENRYFILRRGEDVPKSFEDAKKELETSLRNRRAYAAAAELAEKVDQALKQNKDIDKTAQQFAGEANMDVANMIRETPYIKPGDNVENVGVSQQFEDGIAPLENAGDVGEKTPIQNGFAIPMLVDQKPPRDAELAEVKDQLIEVVKLEKARSMVEETAKKVADAAANGGLSAAASSNGLKAEDQKDYILGSPLGTGPGASRSEELDDAIYAIKAGETLKQPIKVGETWYIVTVNGRTEANMADFAAQRDSLMQQMLQQKRGEVFNEYLEETRRRMEAAGDIKIYQDVLAKLDAADAPATPAMPPQVPQDLQLQQ